MYGNTGERWVQIKSLSLNGLKLDAVESEFTIGNCYPVPHGYVAVEYEGCLLFIPDKVFEEHFVKWDIYKQYYRLGDEIMLGKYIIDNIESDGCCVMLSLRHYLS